MNGVPSILRTSRGTLVYVFAGILVVAVVAAWQFGPDALFLVLIVTGVALVVTGIRNRAGWPRPLLIIVGVLLMLAPLVATVLDIAVEYWVVTLR